MAVQLFAEEVMIVTHGLTYLGQSLERMGLSEGNLCGSLLSGGVGPHDMHRRRTEVLRVCFSRSTASSGWKEQRQDTVREAHRTPRIRQAGSGLTELPSCGLALPTREKEDSRGRRCAAPEHRAASHRRLSAALLTSGSLPSWAVCTCS